MYLERHRLTDQRTERKIRKRSYNWTNGALESTPYVDDPNWGGISTSGGSYAEIYDVPHPGFARRRAAGEVIMGNLIIFRETHDSPDFTFQIGPIPNWGLSKIEGQLGGMVGQRFGRFENFMDADILRAEQIALTNAYAKMNSSPVMGLEILSSLNQTVSMLKRPFGGSLRLLGQMTKYRNKRIRKTAASIAKANADAWLEYRYGWQPLILDAHTICQQASKMHASTTERLVARSSERIGRQQTNQCSASGFGSWPLLTAQGSVLTTCDVEVHAGVLYEVSPQSSSDKLMATLGLRPRDVPSSLWEVIPLSFVVDWFVNVGSWLQAITPVPGITVRDHWVSTKKKRSTELNAVLSYPPVITGDTVHTLAVSESWNNETFTRNTELSLPTAPVVIGRTLSPLRAVDGLSLSVSRILGSLKGLRH